MAAGPATRISDIVVPEIFTPYAQQLSAEKSRLIRSGAVQLDSDFSALLNGGGLTFNLPSFQDLDQDEERVSTDTVSSYYTGGTADPDPNKIETLTEVAVRLERNNSWSATKLAKLLAGADPLEAIASLVADYWVKRQQKAFVAVVNGVFADNAAAPGASEHVQNDLTHDIKGGSYSAGTTDFSAEAFIDATLTMGDSMEDLSMAMMHSVVYGKAQKNNLIDFIPDSTGQIMIPTFLGREVIVDDGMPAASGVYETWLFGQGAVAMGQGTPDVPTEVQRHPGAGNGGGQDVLWNRVRWGFHPKGHAYVGSTPNGGPTNTVLAQATSWQRVFAERKQVKIARLITREHA